MKKYLLIAFALILLPRLFAQSVPPATTLRVARYSISGSAVRLEIGQLSSSGNFTLTSSDLIPGQATTSYGREITPFAGRFVLPLSEWLGMNSIPNYLSNFQRSTETYSLGGTLMVIVSARTTGGGGPTTPVQQGKFANLSTRGFVGSGSSLMIVGIVVAERPKTVLIRAVGPSLSSFGLTGVLAQPVLEVFDSSNQVIHRNTGWGTQSAAVVADIKAKAQAVGAFAIPDGSADSALLVTLAPGNYSVQIKGVNDGTGVAIVEAYEVN